MVDRPDMKILRYVAIGLAWLLGALPGVAFAQRVSDDDVLEIRTVIFRQIDALRRDNADEAFSLASPRIRAAFKTPESFMRDVRASLAPLYRSAALAFRTVLILDDEVVQQVKVTDRFGVAWSVFYPMQRQKDGTWRTNGFQLVREATVST